MYSAGANSVNGSGDSSNILAALLSCAAVLAVLLRGPGAATASSTSQAGTLDCDPALTRLFTPRHPQMGAYEVCTTTLPLAEVAPREWAVHTMAPLDAFGTAGPFKRAWLSRLYGGRQPLVARGWVPFGEHIESRTLISPHPDAEMTTLLPGTLIIRLILSSR